MEVSQSLSSLSTTHPVDRLKQMPRKESAGQAFNPVDRLKQQHALAQKEAAKALLLSRRIEKAIAQQYHVQKSLREAFSSGLNKTTNSLSKQSARSIESYDLDIWRQLEDIVGVPEGYGQYLDEAVRKYDDAQLCQELASLPPRIYSQMNEDMFVKIVAAASGSRISRTEAVLIYNKARSSFVVDNNGNNVNMPGMMNMNNKGEDEGGDVNNRTSSSSVSRVSSNNETTDTSIVPLSPRKSMHWITLMRAIRKHLFLVHLSRLLLETSSNRFLTLGQVPALKWENDNDSLGLANSSSSILGFFGGGVSNNAGTNTPKVVVPSGHHTLMSSVKINQLPKLSALSPNEKKSESFLLRYRFVESFNKQQKHADRIIHNLSEISKQLPISGKSGEHKMAVKFAKHMAAIKMTEVAVSIAKRTQREGWYRWKRVVMILRAETVIRKYLKNLGALRWFQVSSQILAGKLQRAMTRFKSVISMLDGVECFAAVVEIQRIWRGALARFRLLKKLWYDSAVRIQALARGFVYRKRLRDRMRILVTTRAANIIQRKGRSFIRRYNLFKRILLKKQNVLVVHIQKIVRGFLGRRRVLRKRLELKRIQACIKIQALIRRFIATRRVKAKRFLRLQYRLVIVMQCCARKMIARMKVRKLRHLNACAKKIQWRWYWMKANRALKYYREERKMWKTSIFFQKAIRGFLGRRRYRLLLQRHKNQLLKRKGALEQVALIIRGHNALNILIRYKKRREWAVRTLQIRLKALYLGISARREVTAFRESREAEHALRMKWLAMEKERKRIEKLQLRSAIDIERVVRGFMARRRVGKIRMKLRIKNAARKPRPAYYALREEYFSSQNFYHKRFVVRIQCAYRCRKARDIVYYKRRDKSCKIIKRCWAMYKAKKKAKAIVQRKREDIILRHHCATDIQRIVRGFMGRYEARKHRHAEAIKWILLEMKARGHIGKIVINFRAKKAYERYRDRQAAKIQAMIRGVLGRAWFAKQHKRLKRERHNRIKEKRRRAAIYIQSVVRMLQARVIVEKRMAEVEKEREERRRLEEIEGQLEGMHEDWMGEILATRIETQVRGKLAKNAVARKTILTKAEKEEKERLKRANAAIKIQALARGVAARTKFILDLPALRKQMQIRNFCIECEVQVAARKCRQCKDRFCVQCYEVMHKKGARKAHSWEPVRTQQQAMLSTRESTLGVSKASGKDALKKGKNGIAAAANANAAGATAAGKPAGNVIGATKASKKDWEEFYDANAKAKYWFNKVTQEATWVSPW